MQELPTLKELLTGALPATARLDSVAGTGPAGGRGAAKRKADADLVTLLKDDNAIGRDMAESIRKRADTEELSALRAIERDYTAEVVDLVWRVETATKDGGQEAVVGVLTEQLNIKKNLLAAAQEKIACRLAKCA
eukprot:GHVU01123193.1.p1 GENE.GHVU01123193.1~~GHVU01123193.1.p1  ORF type:complete len:135 (+),score=24.91 GHVU01123193.1:167-571(+)